jgi:hypothetical protein
MKLNVGQIVYVIPDKQTVVYPMRVDEEITKKIWHAGEISTETEYSLKSGGANPKHYLLSSIQGEVFESAEHARTVMLDRATRSVNKHIELAVNKATEWFAETAAEPEEDSYSTGDSDTAYVDLGNGVKGKLRLS